MNALLQIAPAILGFLGGPAGGLAGAGLQWLAGKLGATDTTVGAIKAALDGFTPADHVRLREIDVEFQKFCMSQSIALDLAQIEVNREEAKSTNWFVAGGRPAAIWVGVFGLAYAGIVEPMARFVATVVYHYGGAFPVLNTAATDAVLYGLLGLAGARTVEKIKEVARDGR